MDYLVNLSPLRPDAALSARVEAAGVSIRRALAPEADFVADWVREKFNPRWASETAIAMTRQPPTCFLATRDNRLLGIGHALLLASLMDLKSMGYAYAIIGAVGPSRFYEKTVAAMMIPESAPGIYAGMLQF